MATTSGFVGGRLRDVVGELAFVEGRRHAAIENGTHAGKRAGEGPVAQHDDLFLLGPEHGREGEPGRGGGAAQFQHIASSEFPHRGSSAPLQVRSVPCFFGGGRIGPSRSPVKSVL